MPKMSDCWEERRKEKGRVLEMYSNCTVYERVFSLVESFLK